MSIVYLHQRAIDDIVHDMPEFAVSVDGSRSVAAQKRHILRQYRDVLLTQQCLERNLPIPIIIPDALGKPLCQNIPTLKFNHSHSQNHYALVFNFDNIDIGVDIEDLNRKVRFEGMAEHCFCDDEIKLWHHNGDDRELWFRIWTAKEAVLKASGLGIRLNLNEMNTNINPACNFSTTHHAKIGTFRHQYFPYPHSVLTMAYPLLQWDKSPQTNILVSTI